LGSSLSQIACDEIAYEEATNSVQRTTRPAKRKDAKTWVDIHKRWGARFTGLRSQLKGKKMYCGCQSPATLRI